MPGGSVIVERRENFLKVLKGGLGILKAEEEVVEEKQGGGEKAGRE